MKIILVTVLVSFLNFVFSNKTVVLPFKREIIPSDDPENFGKFFMSENVLSVELKVGTPEQSFRVNVHTTDPCTTLLGSTPEVISKGPRFFGNISSSFKTTGIRGYVSSPLGIYAQASISSDKFLIGGVSSPDINFMYTSWTGSNKSLIVNSGVIGLGFNCLQSFLEDMNIITQLFSKQLIQSKTLTFKYLNVSEGEIIIGQYPHEYDKENYKSEDLIVLPLTQILNPINRMSFDNVTFGNTMLEETNLNYASIIPEFGSIKGTTALHQMVLLNFFNKSMEEGLCNRNYTKTNFYYYCINDRQKLKLENFPALTFYIEKFKFNFTFTSDDLFVLYQGKLMFQIVFETNKHARGSWEFGLPFFRKYQATIDMENRTIGFYKKPEAPSQASVKINKGFWGSLIAVGILSFFVGSFVILSIIKNKKRKENYRKKSKNLEYDYHYIQLEDFN